MNSRKIAVISDIHGNRWALEAVLEDIQGRKIRNIINLGDSLYGQLDPVGTFDILKKEDIPSVCGNQDREIIEPGELNPDSESIQFVKEQLTDEQLKWLEALQTVIYPFEDICAFHGTPQSDSEYLLEAVTDKGVVRRSENELKGILSGIDRKLILCGHSHLPGSAQLKDGRLIINPGSVGLQAYSDDTPYPHVMETGTPHARYSVAHMDGGNAVIEQVTVPYDWETASKTAENNGRNEWALWLKTGRALG